MAEIKKNLHFNSKGEEVKKLHRSLTICGFKISKEEMDNNLFGKTTAKAISIFQNKHQLEVTGVADDTTIRKIEEIAAGENLLKISGKISTKNGMAAKDLKVIALDKNLGNDVALGEDITDESGNYSIVYFKEKVINISKQKADVEIKVVDPDDPLETYGTSSVHFNAGKHETINLVLDLEDIDETPEYRQIASQLKPYIGRGSFKDLKEDEDRQDISFLANKTGWDARLVAMVALAEQYSEESGIPADLYYALFRAGIPTTPDDLYLTDEETVEEIWEKAIEENIIDASLKGEIHQNLTNFNETSSAHLLEKAKAVGVSSLDHMLNISMRDKHDRQEFVKLYFNHKWEVNKFWEKAEEKFGKETSAKLQLDGKLGYLSLNNAPLINKLRSGNLIEDDPVDLIRNGLYKEEAWEDLLDNSIKIPEDIPGETEQEKKRNYIDYMVYQLKKSYPTAVVAEMVNHDELLLNSGADMKSAVYKFFRDYSGQFEIGVTPVGKFLGDQNITLDENEDNDKKIKSQLKKIQRVYQISPSDRAMKVLWDKNLDSAYSIVQYDEQGFISRFGKDLGGEEMAKLIYTKAHQVHSTVLSVATSYLTYHTGPKIYALSRLQTDEEGESGLIGYPTLEELFGSLDYCTCEHCRSVLSPAAYLVELLQFINLKPETVEEGANPLDVLLTRRPDIEHIQLTCENTHKVLPYIDLVNEILEYYTVHRDKTNIENWIYNTIQGYEGYNIENGITSEELLANPQFVNDQAYTILKDRVYPFNLPFNLHLETLRLYYHLMKVPLHEAMEKLRVNDDLDTPGGPGDPPYGWRDIYNEYLDLSPEEFRVLTDSGQYKLPAYFGDNENMPFTNFNKKFCSVKVFTRKTGTTYKELIEIIKTQFINPDAHLIPKLEKLNVSFADIKAFKEENLSGVDFDQLLPPDLDQSIYGGDVKEWIKDENNYEKIMHLILLTVPEGEEVDCKFDKLELRYSLPDNTQNSLAEIDYWRLFRFIRLWKKIGWTIEETGKVMTALYKGEFKPVPGESNEIMKTKLDNGFKDLLIKIAHVMKVKEKLNLRRKGSLIKLLALWSDIDTHGSDSLYKQMFLHSTILNIDDVFKEDGYGEYLQDANEKIISHLLGLQAAFNLTVEELSLIREDVGFDDASMLSLENVSKIYRYGFYARSLKLGIQELIALKKMSGIDPFAELEDVHPCILQFIELRQLIKKSGFKITTLGYFLLHEDVTGKASPSYDDILVFAKTLKEGLVRIEQEHKVEDDPTGEITKEKMALVYENDVVDKFFGFLTGTIESSVFDKFPELKVAHDAFLAFTGPENKRFAVVLESILPDFKKKLKRLFIKQTLIASINIEPALVEELLENKDVLHSLEPIAAPAIEDFLKLEETDLSGSVQNFSTTYLRVLKAATLVESLELNEKETRFFGTHTDFHVEGEGFLNAVPVAAKPKTDKVKALFNILMELFRYIRLKESLKIKDQSLSVILENPTAKTENDEALFFKVTGWDKTSTDELLNRFNWSQTDLSNLENFLRVNDAFEIVKKFGVPAADLLAWTLNRPGPEILRDIQDNTRAKYDESAWLEVLQPINDNLRDRRRDALVSYVLHQMQQSNDEGLKKVNTPDKLFEYFLVDMEMEFCMKTSRIKQAISTVQLFIQRCLMNLEPQVSPASIKKDQWEWMKRYRVWEANRKVFLYPENWLEPELRDNKSSCFQELEGELLQADITDELAETALLNYLEKLDEIAKLEICAMYLQENETGNEYDDILYVFARTPGMSRKYFFRRYEYGYWTPWEKVGLDIEDNPILPVVWKGRLLLFWLNIMRKGPEDQKLPESDAAGLVPNQLEGGKEKIEINLSWSEYYNKKWQPMRTSDFEKPITLGEFNVGEFKRESIEISSAFGTEIPGELKIYLSYNNNAILQFFKLYNKHSTPIKDIRQWEFVVEMSVVSQVVDIPSNFLELTESQGDVFSSVVSSDIEITHRPPFSSLVRIFYIPPNYLKLSYPGFEHVVLKKPHAYNVVKPNHQVSNIFTAPFFCQDSKHVFFIEREEKWVRILDYKHFGIHFRPAFIKGDREFPQVWSRPEIIGPWVTKKPPRIGTTGAIDFWDKSIYLNKAVSHSKTITFGDVEIDALGSKHANLLYNNKIGEGNFEAVKRNLFLKGGLK